MTTPKLQRIELRHVQFIPQDLEPGVLYVSRKYGAAVHLCACGCGLKVSTPLRPTEWSLSDTDSRATLHPSVGNWQQPCRSHYWISGGRIIWCQQWTQEQVATGRAMESQRRQAYFESRAPNSAGVLARLWRWICDMFR